MRSLEGLNSEQREAVETVDRHLLVVAGAGSGKTRVLTHKISHLVEDHGIFPSGILAMTFSNKAAAELRERVHLLLPEFEQPRWIGTFHSICVRILKEFHEAASLPQQFSIYDESDQLAAVKRATADVNLDPKLYAPKLIRHYIGMAKNECVKFIDYLEETSPLSKPALRIVQRYEAILKENHALDFGSLLTRVVELLRAQPQVKDRLQKRWRRILIDEYQDTNQIQKELLLELTGPQTIVCAVGDEDQSIYGWRGARVENILEFETDFPGARITKLERNYRSTQSILTAANHVISRNAGRRGKQLWTQIEGGDLPAFIQAEDDHDEARTVIDIVTELHRRKDIPLSEIAIFYRTNVQSRLFEEACRLKNMAYRVFGGIRFYDRAEVKNTMAFLRLACNPSDNVSFERVINLPARGIGKKTLANLAEVADTHFCSQLEAIGRLPHKSKADKALHKFAGWFSKVADGIQELAPEDAAELVLDESGYRDSLEREGTIESESRLENLDELLRSMKEFSEASKGKLPEYLDQISLIADIDSFNPNLDALTLMTVHNSKGLEFEAVFVVGMEEGIFPHRRSIDEGDPDAVEEERRLCYVAMTRAKRHLHLTAASRRRLYQSTQYNPVSRFLGEVPAQAIASQQTPALRASQTYRPSALGGKRSFRKQYADNDEYRQESYDDFDQVSQVQSNNTKSSEAGDRNPYTPGTRVLHPQLGMGTVRKCEGKPDDLKLTIAFKSGGLKKLHLSYCQLKTVD